MGDVPPWDATITVMAYKVKALSSAEWIKYTSLVRAVNTILVATLLTIDQVLVWFTHQYNCPVVFYFSPP